MKLRYNILLSKLADEDLIPGIRQAYLAKRRSTRICWTFLICASIALTIFFIAHIVWEFLDSPIVTKVSIERDKIYYLPDINICLKNDWQRPPSAALSQNESERFIDGWYFFDHYVFDGTFSQWRNVARNETTFLKFMKYKNFDRYLDMIKFMSWDAQDVLICDEKLCPPDYPAEKVVDYNISYPLCYKLNLSAWNSAEILQSQVSPIPWRTVSIKDPLKRLTDADVEVHMSIGGQPPVILPWEYIIHLRISKKHYKRESKAPQPCFIEPPYVGYKLTNCLKFCYERRYFWKTYNCTKFLYLDVTNWTVSQDHNAPYRQLCRMHDLPRKTQTTNRDEVVSWCSEHECKSLCQEDVYSYEILSSVHRPRSDKIELNIFYDPVYNGYQKIEETARYSMISAISDVGGQLGLWTGACFMTIAELAYVFIYFAWKLWRYGSTPSTPDFQAEEMVRRIRMVVADELFKEMLVNLSPADLNRVLLDSLMEKRKPSTATTVSAADFEGLEGTVRHGSGMEKIPNGCAIKRPESFVTKISIE